MGRIVALSLLVLLLALRLLDPSGLQVLRLKTLDLYQEFAATQPHGGAVVIVDVDEKSLADLGQWPWPRTLMAELITRITAEGAAAIATDVLFPEYDRLSPGAIADTVMKEDVLVAEKLRQLPSNDQVLAAALSSSRVVLGQAVYHRPNRQFANAFEHQIGLAMLGPDPAAFLDAYPGIVRNVPELERAAAGLGMVSVRPEVDGVIRKAPLVLMAEGKVLPGLTLELLRVATGESTVLIRSDDAGVNSIVVAGVNIPVDETGNAWMRFSPHDPSLFLSASDVMSGKLPDGALRDKLVLIGSSATGLFDLKATPVDPAMPGVEIHAQLLNAIIDGKLLQRPNWGLAAEVTSSLVLCLVIIFLLPQFGAALTLLIGAAMASAFAAFSWWLFAEQSLLLDFGFPLLSMLAVTGALVVAGYLNEEVERRQIRAAFGQYLSPELVNQLAASPEKLVLGGETRLMTILFSDVRGFTAISESYKENPQALTALINSLLTPLSAAVIRHRGTIDKYMGDNIMAFWNAPLPDADHAANACLAALDMFAALDKLNAERSGEIGPDGNPAAPLNVGIGINTGQCVVGNMGSQQRFDYTVLGDSVNLASRLEGQTKTYGVKIILGGQTAQHAGEACAVLPIDRIRVIGKKEPEEIFTLLGGGGMASLPDFVRLKELQTGLMAAYRGMRWRELDELIAQCQELAPAFGLENLYAMYASRSRLLQRFAPPHDWDGVFDALGK